MISRTRFLITAALVCHLLLAPKLVTSQLRSTVTGKSDTNSSNPLPSEPSSVQRTEDVRIQAIEQEKDGPVYKLRGHVEVHYGTYALYADEMTYNSDTGDATGEGHLVLDGGPNDEHIA